VHAGVVARVVDNEVERFDLGAPDSRPSVIVPSPEGAVWFTRSGDDRIGRIGPEGVVSAVEVLSAGGSPYGLCVGPQQLGEGTEPHGLAVAADGSVWVAMETGVLAHIHASE
jgi:streptogramin lyase